MASTPPAICAARASAPYCHAASGGTPAPAGAAVTGVRSKTSVSRGSRARFRSGSTPKPPAAARATMARPSTAVTTTTCRADPPHGTRRAVPERRHPPVAGVRRTSSSRWAGASASGPVGTSRSARARSHAATIVSASGSGTACRPAALTTMYASAQVPPAPPRASGTSGSVSPFSSTAVQSASGHMPDSADWRTSRVTRSVKRRVTTSARIARSSFIASKAAGPAPSVGGPRRGGFRLRSACRFPFHRPAGPAPSVGGLLEAPGASIVSGPARPAQIVGGLLKVRWASSQPEPARDDAAQDLARATTERERRRVLDEVADRLRGVTARRKRRLDARERVDDLGDLLLERRAHVLDHRGLEVRIVAGLEHAGDGERHLAQRHEVRDQPADDGGGTLARVLPDLADQLDEQHQPRQYPLGPAPLEGELRRHLLPARALLAHPHLLGDEHVLEKDHVEVVRAGQVDDGPDRDPRRFRVHEELREPLVFLRGIVVGPEEGDHEVGAVDVARPDLRAVDAVASRDALGAGADRGEVRARVGLAHPDRERELSPCDGRQKPRPLGFGAEAEQQRARLPVGHPVRRDGGSRRQHLLQHHVALEHGALVTTVTRGPRHADPAAGADLPAELPVEPTPGGRAPRRRAVTELGAEEVAHLPAHDPGRRGPLAEPR